MKVTSSLLVILYLTGLTACKLLGSQKGDNQNMSNETNFTSLDVRISGPVFLDAGEKGTWTASVSGGDGNYTYEWYFKSADTNGQWSGPVSTTDSYVTQMYSFDQYLKLKVDVSGDQYQGVDTYHMNCNGCSPCPGCPI